MKIKQAGYSVLALLRQKLTLPVLFNVMYSNEKFIEKAGLSGKRFRLKICKDFDSYNLYTGICSA